jgi:acyl-coenzyme A synthetase/AMP-(fatty) acid ligase
MLRLVMNTSFLPMFHMMGISTHIIQPLMTGTIASIFGINYPSIPPPPTPRLVIDVMRKTDATAACVAPTFLEVSLFAAHHHCSHSLSLSRLGLMTNHPSAS